MINFKFNQDYSHNGHKVSFIGYMSDGKSAQVAKKTGNRCVNVIVPLGELADLIQPKPTRSKPASETQVQDTASA